MLVLCTKSACRKARAAFFPGSVDARNTRKPRLTLGAISLQEISEGKLTVGDLVLFLALMSQLYG